MTSISFVVFAAIIGLSMMIIMGPSVLDEDERPNFYLGPLSIIRSYRRTWPIDRADRYNP